MVLLSLMGTATPDQCWHWGHSEALSGRVGRPTSCGQAYIVWAGLHRLRRAPSGRSHCMVQAGPVSPAQAKASSTDTPLPLKSWQSLAKWHAEEQGVRASGGAWH